MLAAFEGPGAPPHPDSVYGPGEQQGGTDYKDVSGVSSADIDKVRRMIWCENPVACCNLCDDLYQSAPKHAGLAIGIARMNGAFRCRAAGCRRSIDCETYRFPWTPGEYNVPSCPLGKHWPRMPYVAFGSANSNIIRRSHRRMYSC